MIISRTPLRISLVGGGTDIPQFYRRHGGAVVSLAINRYVYISVNPKFDGRTRVSYSQTENVDNLEEIQHDLVRETLILLAEHGLEITSTSDIPGSGTGLGSSSSFLVGLLTALSQKINGHIYPRKVLAETAYTIETRLCQHLGVGKQDHYAAAFGGLHYYEFHGDESVSVEPINIAPGQVRELEDHFLLLYTGITRESNTVLEDQVKNITTRRKVEKHAVELKELAFDLGTEMQAGSFQNVGSYLRRGWELKKKLSDKVSSSGLNETYIKALHAGAEGGKLLGAGGGGFFLFYADPQHHDAIVKATGLRREVFRIEPNGSEVIYDSQKETFVCR